MAEGMTCYERDEAFCEDQMCLRVGCRLQNERLSAESKMPAKIWAQNEHPPFFNKREVFDTTPYIRADLVEPLVEALREAKHWASTRCPAREEKPDPCPLCGAKVDGKGLDGVCKSVEAIFPRALLAQLSAALQAYEAAQ